MMADSSEHYVFTDTMFVRSGPAQNATVIDTLYAGDEVLLINKSGGHLVLKGFSAPWVNISYRRNGVARQGVAWSGLLSFNPMRRGQTKFVYGLDRRWSRDTTIDKERVELAKILVRIKVVENGRVIAGNSFFAEDNGEHVYMQSKVAPGGGLDSVRHIIYIGFGGEACGVPFYSHPFAWTGRKLVPMPLLTDVSDAGVYYQLETFVLPAEKGGRKNMLILKAETGEATDESMENGEPEFKISKTAQYFSWDGKAFKPLKK